MKPEFLTSITNNNISRKQCFSDGLDVHVSVARVCRGDIIMRYDTYHRRLTNEFPNVFRDRVTHNKLGLKYLSTFSPKSSHSYGGSSSRRTDLEKIEFWRTPGSVDLRLSTWVV